MLGAGQSIRCIITFNSDGSNLGGRVLVMKGLLKEETFKLTAKAQVVTDKQRKEGLASMC